MKLDGSVYHGNTAIGGGLGVVGPGIRVTAPGVYTGPFVLYNPVNLGSPVSFCLADDGLGSCTQSLQVKGSGDVVITVVAAPEGLYVPSATYTFASVPEPSTSLIIVSGLLALIAARRLHL